MDRRKFFDRLHGLYLSATQEYQENEPNLVIEAPESNQAVLLFNCKNVTLQIKGKLNAVSMSMDSCPHISICVDL